LNAKIIEEYDNYDVKIVNRRFIIRDGWYIDQNNNRKVQKMHYVYNFGDGLILKFQKGIRTILKERNKFKNNKGHVLKLICNYCKENRWEARYRAIQDGYIQPECCAAYVLSNEPDFLEQKEWLTEVVEAAGFEAIFYPKYHPELNFIEMVWGWIKAYHRRTCTYNYNDLKNNLPDTLENKLPLAFVRTAYNHCDRFMSGYMMNIEGPLLDFAMKKYKGHRRFPNHLIDNEEDKLNKLKDDYLKHCNKKMKK
jgi:transposase